ncbi:DUF3219 family protein [Aquibacillus kalidii]|uniref:DUF3219 family protein n=1 Tax=Aquibacillus kalidii TaxID=2762597 RepID=UPI0016472F39|nr:DUF3219 family protein [Aquibacillus kalidii]
MVTEIYLDDYLLHLTKYDEEIENNINKITVVFKVTHEQYHDVSTLLYRGSFHVKVPKRDLEFKGKIVNYSTSITNLYNKGEVGEFRVTLLEE